MCLFLILYITRSLFFDCVVTSDFNQLWLIPPHLFDFGCLQVVTSVSTPVGYSVCYLSCFSSFETYFAHATDHYAVAITLSIERINEGTFSSTSALPCSLHLFVPFALSWSFVSEFLQWNLIGEVLCLEQKLLEFMFAGKCICKAFSGICFQKLHALIYWQGSETYLLQMLDARGRSSFKA